MVETTLPQAAGIGLRQPHHAEFLNAPPAIAWVEVHSENFLGGGLPYLEKVRAHYPVSLHGVGLSLGSAEGIDPLHLERIAALDQRIQPQAVSDHLSWSVTGGHYYNDLLPLPYTEETLAIMADNIQRVQERLKRTILVENPSTYLQAKADQQSEAEFIKALCQRTGCGLLLDINNIIVGAFNHQFDAKHYIDSISALAVGEYHLAGHFTRQLGNRAIKIDDHGSPVPREVWDLFDYALQKIGKRPVLIERDSEIPPMDDLLAEAALAQAHLDAA